MHRFPDPLALDPLGPIADIRSTNDARTLEPLSPLAEAPWQRAAGHPVARTGHATGDPPGRDALRPAATLPS